MASANRQQNKLDATFKAMFKTDADNFQKLLECLEPLRQNHVQVDSFMLSDLLSFFLTPTRMVKHVQVLTTIPYKDVRDSVLSKAYSLGICPQSHEMNLLHIYEVCEWMKTRTGTEAIVEVQRTEKLKRRAISQGRTVAESAMIRAFNAQLAEYSSELKKALQDDSVGLQDKYWPVSVFNVATNISQEEAVLAYCRNDGVKGGLFKNVEGLIERKMKNFAIREASKLRVVLKEMQCFGVPVDEDVEVEFSPTKDANCRVGGKRKSVLGHSGETSYEMKKRPKQNK